MAVHSKMTAPKAAGSRGPASLAVGALGSGALALAQMGQVGYVAPGSRALGQTRSKLAGAVAVAPVRPSEGASAGTSRAATVAGASLATALLGAAGRKPREPRARGSAGALRESDLPVQVAADAAERQPPRNGLEGLLDVAAALVARPQDLDGAAAVRRVGELAAAAVQRRGGLHAKAFEEVVAGAQSALQETTQGQLRWAASAVAGMLLAFTGTLQPASALEKATYSDFLNEVQQGKVEMVRVQNDLLTAQYVSKDGSRHEVNLVPNANVDDELFNQLAEKKVDVVMQSKGDSEGGPLDFLARLAGPVAWLVAGLLLLFGGGGPAGGMGGQNPFELGKSPAKVIKEGDLKVKFSDVAGCDGAKEELVEVVDFLKSASRYSALGAKIPKGALLVGPPGTGKTLLAKAVAGEAAVPFFSVSAAEFVEVYAGIGASRVRDLFAEAKKSAPCIVFIDEIDAVGRQRSAGFGQGNDEREQTVNQLLTEMDGFEGNDGVVVLAATNRADVLDQALVRPGRFDRQIQVDPPDVRGREDILKVHARGRSLAPGVDLAAIARQTPGMSGADLANLLNEGAIVAARRSGTSVEQEDILNALERITIGLEKKDAVMSEKKKALVAYHEAGHALLGALMRDYDVVAKVSIVPRGPAGGVTIFMPSEERLNSGLYSKEFLENRMCVALGGRIAEELLNGKDNVTTGASNDFQQCTQVAQAMVMQLGMSEVVGQRALSQPSGGSPFMGRDYMGQGSPPMSQNLKQLVDQEVKRIVAEQYERGLFLLKSNRHLLDKLAALLVEEEKIGGEELIRLVNQAAAAGEVVTTQKELVAAAFVGDNTPMPLPAKKSQCLHPDKPAIFACADCPRRQNRACTNGTEDDEERVSAMVRENFSSLAAPEVVREVSSKVLAALAATAVPLAAHAEAMPAAIPSAQVQQQQQVQQVQQGARVSGRVTYTRLLEFLDQGAVSRVDLYDMGRSAVAKVQVGDGRVQDLICDLPGATAAFMDRLQQKDVAIEVHAPEKPNELLRVLGDVAFPMIVILGLLFFRSRGPGASQGGGGGLPGLGDNSAKVMITPETGVKFADVAGIDEAKEELTEIVDFLQAPERFVRVGAKIPKGVLLTGPPGTGKTLMAKALAGESGVPFIQASAAEFIELFVGVGASRVREIFKQAKQKAPCIVFIDEIDAIGRQRGAGMGGGNDEREQTLNQILTEMDGFEGNMGVIVVAATNRADILDGALLRPGRFDRRVQVGLPDVAGRKQILQVHVRNKKLAEGVTLDEVAKRTAGFSGADLENLMNESAILAARRKKQEISLEEITDATDRVIAGLEGRALPDNASKKLIAYHEAGHALVGTLLPHHDEVNKVTVVPRGQAKGLTWFTPNEDQSLLSAAQLKARIAGALGGRAAEQLVFGSAKVTSGAGGDLQQVERLARAMVTQFGMSDVGYIAVDDGGFSGPNYSEELGSRIDAAIRGLSDEGYQRALALLSEHRQCLDRIAEELVENETISGQRLRELVAEYAAVPEKMAAV